MRSVASDRPKPSKEPNCDGPSSSKDGPGSNGSSAVLPSRQKPQGRLSKILAKDATIAEDQQPLQPSTSSDSTGNDGHAKTLAVQEDEQMRRRRRSRATPVLPSVAMNGSAGSGLRNSSEKLGDNQKPPQPKERRLEPLNVEELKKKMKGSAVDGERPEETGATASGVAPAATADGEPPPAPQIEPPAKQSISTMAKVMKLLRRNKVQTSENAEAANFLMKFGLGNRKFEIGTGQTAGDEPAFTGSRFQYLCRKWVLDTKDELYYYWLGFISCAFAYNLVVVIARSVFYELATGVLWYVWMALDIAMDLVYLLDMFVRSRTGFLEQGLLVRDIPRIRKMYLRSTQFKMDLLSVLPLDIVVSLATTSPKAFLRFNRMIRYPRLSDFVDRTETRSSMPNAFRVFCVVVNIVVIIHWNACIYFYISELIGLGSDSWVYGQLNKQSLPDGVNDTLARRYIYSFYWSTLILTTIGEVPGPVRNEEFVFVTMDLMCGVLIFATIVGNVGSMISNMSAARTEFQNKMDGVKQYMELRKVSKQLETRVIKWFDYLWCNKQSLNEQQALRVLPDKLQAEIAMQVHFETLRKVRIFQDCESGLLAELVLKLQQQVFSPGDYICRKGDIGREMYIVKRGKLQVVADDGIKVFVTLQEGAVFGELSILNIAGSKNGNRRTANVRSVGYTDLFVLNKQDLWTALKEYPEARKLLIAKGREILRKDNLLDENAPEEQVTPEELAESLQTALKTTQTRMARFVAEFTSSKAKLLKRIEFLEKQLSKYQSVPHDGTHNRTSVDRAH